MLCHVDIRKRSPTMGKKTGFSKLLKKHTNNIEAQEILSPNTDQALLNVINHCVTLRAFFAISTSRAGNSVQVYIKLDDEQMKEWLNTPEEALDKLIEIDDCLVESMRDRGLLKRP
jgi:hypothetical protein